MLLSKLQPSGTGKNLLDSSDYDGTVKCVKSRFVESCNKHFVVFVHIVFLISFLHSVETRMGSSVTP